MNCPYCEIRGRIIEKVLDPEREYYTFVCPKCGDSHRQNILEVALDED